MKKTNELYLDNSFHKCIVGAQNALVNPTYQRKSIMQNNPSLTRNVVREDHQGIDRDERLRRELAREWAHDPTARWVLALDGAIRRAARAVAAWFGRA
jgi:hypothetical protein